MKRTRIFPGDGDPRHGTDNGYVNLGCHCPACSAAHSVATTEQRKRPRPGPIPATLVHGTRYARAYWHCKCETCYPPRPVHHKAPPLPPSYMRVHEVLDVLGCSRTWLDKLAIRGDLIPFRKIGGAVYYLREEVEHLPLLVRNRGPVGAHRSKMTLAELDRLMEAMG